MTGLHKSLQGHSVLRGDVIVKSHEAHRGHCSKMSSCLSVCFSARSQIIHPHLAFIGSVSDARELNTEKLKVQVLYTHMYVEQSAQYESPWDQLVKQKCRKIFGLILFVDAICLVLWFKFNVSNKCNSYIFCELSSQNCPKTLSLKCLLARDLLLLEVASVNRMCL